MDNPNFTSKNKILAQLKAIRKEVFLKTPLSSEQKSRGVFHPESSFRLFWDFLLIFFVLYQAFSVPYLICFSITSASIEDLELVSVLVFILDISNPYSVINFNTAFYSKGSLVAARQKILANYLKMWFWLDLVSSFPYSWITDGVATTGDQSGSAQGSGNLFLIVRMFRFFRILRLIRLIKLKSLLIKIEDYIASDTVADFFLFARLLALIFLIAHWIACWFYFIGDQEADDWPESWVSQLRINGEVSNGEAYVSALYFAFTTMTTVGYGDITPITTNERIYVTFAMILSCGMFAFMIGSIGSLVQKQNSVARKYRERVVNLNQYMKKHDLPGDLQFRVRRFLEYIWEMQTKDNINEKEILATLSEPLKDEVYAQVNGAIINICPVFTDFDQSYVSQLSKLLVPESFAPGDVVFEQGQIGGKMYYVVHGKIDVYHQATASSFKVLHTKNYFGEIGFFIGEPRCASTRCLEFADMLSLDRTETDKILAKYPEVVERYRVLALTVHTADDLSVLQVKCYICKKPGHVATRCKGALLNLDHEEVRNKWLQTRNAKTKHISTAVPAIPNHERAEKHVMKKFDSRNVLGYKRNVKELFPEDEKLYPMVQEYMENYLRIKNKSASTSDSSVANPSKTHGKPRYSIIYQDTSSSEDECEIGEEWRNKDASGTRDYAETVGMKSFRKSLLCIPENEDESKIQRDRYKEEERMDFARPEGVKLMNPGFGKSLPLMPIFAGKNRCQGEMIDLDESESPYLSHNTPRSGVPTFKDWEEAKEKGLKSSGTESPL